VFRGYGPRISFPRASGPCSEIGRSDVADDLEDMLRRLARDFDEAAKISKLVRQRCVHPEFRS